MIWIDTDSYQILGQKYGLPSQKCGKSECVMCNHCSTVRVWNVKKPKKHKSLVRTKSKQGHKTVVTTCTYSRDGHYVTMACQDGSIQMWDRRKLFVSTPTSTQTHTPTPTPLSNGSNNSILKITDIRLI